MTVSSSQLLNSLKQSHNLLFTKTKKFIDSHGNFDDYSEFFASFLENEDEFLKKENMPKDWNSCRAYSSGFETLIKVINILEVKEYLNKTIGEEQYNTIIHKFTEKKKHYNNQAKCEKTSLNEDQSVSECTSSSETICTKCRKMKSLINKLSELETDPVKAYLLKLALETI